MKIISADERLQQQTGVKMAIFGSFGIGKTSLLKTLDEPTLCLDFEAGLLAVQDWSGDSLTVRTWPEAKDIACLVGGANPALDNSKCYSQRHYENVNAKYKEFDISKYKCIFIDSITMVSKICLGWARAQVEQNKYGKSDTWAAYALL
ncbi:MAG: ATP-binding protein, partial [Holosporaceae bacterium]|nr:ATP-binding protein [Holosporaceae bacterium]